MTRLCILHLGLHKTATSTIQKSFSGYEDGRLSYADLQIDNHSRPLQMLFCDTYRHVAEPDLPQGVFKGLSRARLQEKLDRQVVQGRQNLLFSAEELTRSFKPVDVARLLAYLRPHFDVVQAIAYLREPLDMMRSTQQQAIRAYYTPQDPAKRYIHFAQRLQKWERALGRENMIYALFDRTAMGGDDIVADFAHRLDLTVPKKRVGTENRSLTADAFAVLYAFRKAQAERGQRPELHRERPAIARLTRHVSAPFHFATPFWGDVRTMFAQDIAWAEKRLGRPFPDPMPAPTHAVVFESEADILDHATQARPDLSRWALRMAVPFTDRARMLKKIIRAQV